MSSMLISMAIFAVIVFMVIAQKILNYMKGKKGNKMIIHCMFEQSGTFKNEFKKLGYESYDYDILNDFNQTDYIIDLFKEIENGYENKKSIFDSISQDDSIGP